MGSLERRLERLEEKNDEPRRKFSEEERKQHWLAVTRARWGQELGRGGAWQVKDVVRLLRRRREATTTEELREQLLAWRPPHDRNLLERELARAIYSKEPGTENMACPEEWRDSFDAGAELLRRYEDIPDEVLAKGYLELRHIEEGEEEEDFFRWKERYEDPYGITDHLVEAACGPDAVEVTEDERHRRLEECLSSAIHGEKGYRIARHMDHMDHMERLTKEGDNHDEYNDEDDNGAAGEQS